MQAADHVVELGPGSGEKGGEVVFQGPPSGSGAADTVTGLYLSGRESIPVPKKRRRVDGPRLSLRAPGSITCGTWTWRSPWGPSRW